MTLMIEKPFPHGSSLLTVYIILILCMCATNHRNTIWNREGTLWQDTIKKSPLKARPYNSLGIHYMEEKKYLQAIKRFKHALELNPTYYLAYNNLGTAYEIQGYYQKADWAYKKTLHLSPSFAKAIYNLGKL